MKQGNGNTGWALLAEECLVANGVPRVLALGKRGHCLLIALGTLQLGRRYAAFCAYCTSRVAALLRLQGTPAIHFPAKEVFCHQQS